MGKVGFSFTPLVEACPAVGLRNSREKEISSYTQSLDSDRAKHQFLFSPCQEHDLGQMKSPL